MSDVPYRVTYLTLASTSYFAILDCTWGEGHPRLVCPLIEIELCDNDMRKDRDVLNLTVPDFATLCHILTFPGQVKQNMLLFGKVMFFVNNF